MTPADLESALLQPFSVETWQRLLPQLLPGVSLFAKPPSLPLTSESERAVATSLSQFGTARLADGKGVGLFLIEARPGVDLSRNRVGLRQLAARWIDQGDLHAALAFSHQPETGFYRLTFAARESVFTPDLQVVTKETATRRFTYILGPGERRRTAAQRLALLADRRPGLTIKELTDAFSVEKLSREFFATYKEHYTAFCSHLLESDAPARVFRLALDGLDGKARDRALKPVRDFVKKLLGRLVFLHFLQKKGWLGCDPASADWQGGPPDFLHRLFDTAPAAEQKRFHSRRLVPLFFDTLNRPERPGDLFPVTGTRVPYLNGGLFERDFTGVERLDFPAPLFAALLDFFGHYHFTIDENDPQDHEIGIDPEMLGHIFENLLEDNKDKGAYYTPKAVVQYMCQQSLIHALAGHFPGDAAARAEIETLIRTKAPVDARKERTWLARHATRLATLLDDLRICDPAIGSGAFPIGLLQEIYWTKLALNPSLDRAAAKRAIIQRSIHGVDLDAGAVEIARLRFWLALIVEEDAPVPLPNLDYQIMQGNSLLESFEGERLDDLADPVRYGVRILGSDQPVFDFAAAAQAELHDPRNAPAADLAHLRRDYYACHDPEEKSRLRTDIDAAVLRAIDARIARRRDELETSLTQEAAFTRGRDRSAKEQKKRDANEAELTALTGKSARLHSLLADPRAERPFFLWHLWFRHILAAPPDGNGGFDIVIGNPPYVRADNPDFLPQRAAILAEKHGSEPAFKTLWEKWDLFVPFIEQGHALLRPGGIETMIVSDAYCHSKYAIRSQDWFLQNAIVQRFDFLGKLQIFEAGVKNMIFFYARGDGAANMPERRLHTENFGNVTPLPSEPQATATHRLFFPEGTSEQFAGFTTEVVPIERICYISKGMVVHADEELARGAFALADLVSSAQDAIHSVPFVEAKMLDRWLPRLNKWLEWGTERAPALFSRPTFPEIYSAPEKLISVDLAAGLSEQKVTYDALNLRHNHSAWSFVPWHYLKDVRNRSLKKSARYPDEMKPGDELPDRRELETLSRGFDAKFLVAVMNSKVARLYLMQHRRSNIHLFPDDWKSLPVPVVPKTGQAPVIALVDRILAAKRAGDAAAVGSLEAEIDARVFQLYGLTPEEIRLIEGPA